MRRKQAEAAARLARERKEIKTKIMEIFRKIDGIVGVRVRMHTYPWMWIDNETHFICDEVTEWFWSEGLNFERVLDHRQPCLDLFVFLDELRSDTSDSITTEDDD